VLLGLPGAFRQRGIDKPLPCAKVKPRNGSAIRCVRSIAMPCRRPAQRYAGRRRPLRLLVIGGSLGAKALNQTSCPRPWPSMHRGRSVRSCGISPAPSTSTNCKRQLRRRRASRPSAWRIIDDMAEAYAWCDVVLCRAGASTVAELAAAGVPAGMVPFPSRRRRSPDG
jgi:UDP-N-acetylglucosamine--N-acetylmuramyl-(pentapeptide) pyrophosphoryl-undecaprenol N-acetylglucosamine transferase